jgi:hypothetical protein
VAFEARYAPGAEHVIVTETDGHTLAADGVVVAMLDSGPGRIAYDLATDATGGTRRLSVRVDDPRGSWRVVLGSDGGGQWWEGDRRPRPDLAGGIDVDITVTPLTNTLPIRRLRLPAGGSAEILAVYVNVDARTVTAVPQRYTHLDGAGLAGRYRYEAGSFRADITVDAGGLVLDYPGYWRRMPPAEPPTP